MEEKNTVGTTKENTTAKKFTYEQLEDIAKQLSSQLQNALRKIEMLNIENAKVRLTFLFKVVENASAFNYNFVESCTKEIEGLMTLPDNEEDAEDSDKK